MSTSTTTTKSTATACCMCGRVLTGGIDTFGEWNHPLCAEHYFETEYDSEDFDSVCDRIDELQEELDDQEELIRSAQDDVEILIQDIETGTLTNRGIIQRLQRIVEVLV